jgi:hypothetical protein
MYKITLFIAFFCIHTSTFSQVIRVGVYGGETSIGSNNSGISIGGELSFAKKSNFDFGIHLGSGTDIGTRYTSYAANFYGLHTRYYLSKSALKPYIGLKTTLFLNTLVDESKNFQKNKDKITFGISPLIGIKFGPLNLNSGYTIGGGDFKGMNYNIGFLFGFGKFKD